MGNVPSYEPPPMSDFRSRPMSIIDGNYVCMTPSNMFLRGLDNSTIEVVLSGQQDHPADWTVVPKKSSVLRLIKSQTLFNASTGAAMCTFMPDMASNRGKHLVFRGGIESAEERDDMLALRLKSAHVSRAIAFQGFTAEHETLYILAPYHSEDIYVFVGDPKDGGGALVAQAKNIAKPDHCNYQVEVSAGVDRAALVCMLLIAHRARQDWRSRD